MVANHYESYYDGMSQAAKDLPASNNPDASRKYYDMWKAYREAGEITHTDEEKEQNKQGYRDLIKQLIEDPGSARDVFDNLQQTLVNFNSGGSKNTTLLSMLNSFNSSPVNDMYSYWTKLLKA